MSSVGTFPGGSIHAVSLAAVPDETRYFNGGAPRLFLDEDAAEEDLKGEKIVAIVFAGVTVAFSLL